MLPHLYAHGMRLAACWRCHAVLSTYLSFVALLTREQEPHLTKAILESVILAGSTFPPCLSVCLAELGSLLMSMCMCVTSKSSAKLRVRMSESPKNFRLRRRLRRAASPAKPVYTSGPHPCQRLDRKKLSKSVTLHSTRLAHVKQTKDSTVRMTSSQ